MSGALNHAARLHTTALITLVRFFLRPERDCDGLFIWGVDSVADTSVRIGPNIRPSTRADGLGFWRALVFIDAGIPHMTLVAAEAVLFARWGSEKHLEPLRFQPVGDALPRPFDVSAEPVQRFDDHP